MESFCIYISVLWVPSRTVVQCYYFVFHPHESAWWAPLNRFYAGLAGFAKTCIGPILRVLQASPPRGAPTTIATEAPAASSSSKKPSVSWVHNVFETGLSQKLGPELEKSASIR